MAKQNRPPKLRRLAAAWRVHVQSRILDLDAELGSMNPDPGSKSESLRDHARQRLADTLKIVEKAPSLKGAWTGVDVEYGWVTVHSVQVDIIRLSDPQYAAAKLPDIIADAEQVLPDNDRRLISLRNYCQALPNLDENTKESIAHIAADVHSETANAHVRARSFRNILLATAFALTLFAMAFGLVGYLSPKSINLCAPQNQSASAAPQSQPKVTCPTARQAPSGGDVFLVELLGLFGASLIGAMAIRQMIGTSTPYAIPLASLLVKLPAGAMTAVGGLLLMRAGVLGPLLAASETPQVLAYALVFGASQQTFTRLIDQQAQSVLNNVPSPVTSATPAPSQSAPSTSSQGAPPLGPSHSAPPTPGQNHSRGDSTAGDGIPMAVADTRNSHQANPVNSRWG